MSDTPKEAAQMPRSSGRSAFGVDAAGYHAGRIGYPTALFEDLFARCRPHPAVLEIGAGTGHATAALLAHGADSLTAVEPDRSQIAFLQAHLIDPRLRFVTGAFPEVARELAQAERFDLITAAACFHWMEPGPALAAVRTLLRPGGVWGMWWNSYRNPGEGDALAEAVSPLIKTLPLPPSQTLEQHYSLDIDHHCQTLGDAGFSDIRHQIYRRERVLTATRTRALYASYSFIRVVTEPEQTELLDAIAAIVERDFGGRAPNLVLTACYSAVAPD
jgi:SAM-dependent methyltransferase